MLTTVTGFAAVLDGVTAPGSGFTRKVGVRSDAAAFAEVLLRGEAEVEALLGGVAEVEVLPREVAAVVAAAEPERAATAEGLATAVCGEVAEMAAIAE